MNRIPVATVVDDGEILDDDDVRGAADQSGDDDDGAAAADDMMRVMAQNQHAGFGCSLSSHEPSLHL